MIIRFLASVFLSTCLFAQQQGVEGGKKLSVVVTAFVGRTESDDCLIFKTTKGEFYIYDSNNIGAGFAKLLKKSLETKRPVCLVLDPSLKGYVLGVLPSCKPGKRLTNRSTRTLPLRVTVLGKRSDFSSLTFRAASAAPVNSIR